MRHVSVQQISAYVDSALTGVSRELVTRHLAACASCRERHAAWRKQDEALRRVLSWEPDERTLEEWSSRVELAITAERKGLPAPEFSALQHPVLAPRPEPRVGQVQEVVSHARPQQAPPEPPEPAREAPGEARVAGASAQIEDAATALAHIAMSVSARVHDPGPPSEPVPPPVAERVRPEPAVASAATRARTVQPTRRPPRRSHRVLVACATMLLGVIIASPFLPEVIRIPLPERWLPRLPRVEFVRQGDSPAAHGPVTPRDAPVSPASRSPVGAERVPDAPLTAQAETLAIAARGADVIEPLVAEPPMEPATAPVPGAAMESQQKRAQLGSAASPEPTGRENPGTMVPVRVKTTVQLAPAARREPPPAANARAEPEADEAWPLLCGEVLDDAGAPVEGARVVLVSPALTVRTDRRGRFCVACPAGVRTLRVEAEGHAPASRSVELSLGMIETRITLAPAP